MDASAALWREAGLVAVRTAQFEGCFEYVYTPKHGSWLNLIGCAFSKMARTFLRQLRVSSKEGLKKRILAGIEEINVAPVVFRWSKFDLGVA